MVARYTYYMFSSSEMRLQKQSTTESRLEWAAERMGPVCSKVFFLDKVPLLCT